MSFTEGSPESSAAHFARKLAAARAREPGALDELFDRFYPQIERKVHLALAKDLRLNRPWLSTRISTGDVVQEVFRSVLADLHGFSGATEEAFAGYLASVVRNRLLDVVRYHEADQRDGRRTLARPEIEEVSPHDGPATDAISAEERQVYEEVLATFTERERALLRGRIEHGREFKDLTDALGFSSLSATRRAFYAAQAQLVVRIRRHDSERSS